MLCSGLSIFIPICNLAGRDVDEHIQWVRKRRPTLDMMVADQPNDFALRKYCSFVVERAVAKVKDEPRRDPVAVANLNEIAIRNRLSILRLQHQEAMKCALRSANRNRIGGHRPRTKHCQPNRQQSYTRRMGPEGRNNKLLSYESLALGRRKDLRGCVRNNRHFKMA